MIVPVRLCVLGTIALSLPLLQHAQLVQSSSSSLVLSDQKNEAAVIEYHYGAAWCRSPTATVSQGQPYVVDPSSELQQLQSLGETQ